jgi:ParB-like chromosome segregation protein Spo0J
VSGQLTLLPTHAPEVRRERLALEAITGFEDAVPSAKLRELIRDLGLLQPIVVVPNGPELYRLVEGRRRCKAIAQLAASGEWPAPPHVDALVLGGRQIARGEVRGGLTLALHATRSPSPASELQAIETILQAAGGETEAVTVKAIAAQTGISIQTVRRRLRLRALTRALRVAFDAGAISVSVAEAAARLPEEKQAMLERQLDQTSRLTLTDVREVAREQITRATAALPGELFGEPEPDWRTTVSGHLTAALAAVPGEPSVLRQRILDALGTIDGRDRQRVS